MNLQTIRNTLNDLDIKLIKLIAKRQSYAPHVAKYKIKHGLPIFQKEREVEIMQKIKDVSIQEGVNQEMIEKIFTLILKDSKNIQKHTGKKI